MGKKVFYILAIIIIGIYMASGFSTILGGKETMSKIFYFAGKGTETSPYLIQTPTELQKLSELVDNGNEFKNTYFKQTIDLDMQNIENFTPIGRYESKNYFYGTYDGAGFRIINLKIDEKNTNVALFGILGGVVKNLGIESGLIQGSCVGSIASHSIGNGAKIINCYNKATIRATGRAGGIADNFGQGQIINCWNEGKLEAPVIAGISSYTAGLVYNSYSIQENIVNQYFAGTINFASGGNHQSKKDLVKKMNNGIQAAILEFELEEDSFHPWQIKDEIIMLRQE